MINTKVQPDIALGPLTRPGSAIIALNIVYGWPIILLGPGLAGIGLVILRLGTAIYLISKRGFLIGEVKIFAGLAALAFWTACVSYPFDSDREQNTMLLLLFSSLPIFLAFSYLQTLPWNMILALGLPAVGLTLLAHTTSAIATFGISSPLSNIVEGHIAWICLLAALNARLPLPIQMSLTVACGSALYLTGSSGPSVTGLIVIAYFANKRLRSIPAKVMAVAASLILAILIVNSVRSEIDTVPTEINNSLTRIEAWEVVATNFTPSGHGVAEISLRDGRQLGNAHNFILDTLWVGGLFGLSLLSFALITSWLRSRTSSRADRALKLGLLIGALFSGSVSSAEVWMALGLGLNGPSVNRDGDDA